MTDTANLGLPFIDGSQAQKHITHNEALRILDATVQLAVLDTTRTLPPASPVDGERHLIASGATGAWSGQSGAIVAWEDDAWRFLNPKAGWLLWSAADASLFIFDGLHWTAFSGGSPSALDNLVHLGVNASASSPNLLTVRSNAALFNAIEAADGGTSDARLQISKSASGNTASVVFSDAFSGRAEFGLVGSDAFKLKVSNDGSSFIEAFNIDQATGNLGLPRGVLLTGVIAPPQITANQNDYAPSNFLGASVLQVSSDASRSVSGLAGGAEGRIIVVLNVGNQPVTLLDESTSSLAANRFTLGADLLLAAKQAAILRYDGTASRWFALARTASGGGSGGVSAITAGTGLSGGTITSSGTLALADDVRRNMLLDRIYQSKWYGGYRRFINAFADGYKASDGINAGASSNYAVNSGLGYVGPTSAAGTQHTVSSAIGNMTSNGGLASAFDGSTNQAAAVSAGLINGADAYVGANFSAAPKQIGSVQVFGTNNVGYFSPNSGSALVSMTIEIRGKATAPASGADGTLLGTLTFTNSNDEHIARAITSTDASTAWAYVWARLITPSSGNLFFGEVQFFAPGTMNNMTLVTASQTADAAMGYGRVLLEYDGTASPVLNTDLTVEVSCNGGTNWTATTLSSVTSYSGGAAQRKVAETADTACTSGTLFAARIKTLNNKAIGIYGVSITAR